MTSIELLLARLCYSKVDNHYLNNNNFFIKNNMVFEKSPNNNIYSVNFDVMDYFKYKIILNCCIENQIL